VRACCSLARPPDTPQWRVSRLWRVWLRLGVSQGLGLMPGVLVVAETAFVDAGIVSGVQKHLEAIKGFSEAKVAKVQEACYKLKNPLQFTVRSQGRCQCA
jgi:hypothetical protein